MAPEAMGSSCHSESTDASHYETWNCQSEMIIWCGRQRLERRITRRIYKTSFSRVLQELNKQEIRTL